MKKLETKQIIGLAALAVGALVVGKILRDVKKIRQMAEEKEELLLDPEEDVNPFAADEEELPVVEADAEDVIEELAADEIVADAVEEVSVDEITVADVPAEETVEAPAADAQEIVSEEPTVNE